MSASTSRIFHVWFSTKYRKSVLHEEIRDTILGEFARVADGSSIRVLEVEAIEDHVHLLIALASDQELSVAIHDLKGTSARQVFLKYPELKLDMHSNSFWQKGYGSRLVTLREVPLVRRYIRTQNERPLRHE